MRNVWNCSQCKKIEIPFYVIEEWMRYHVERFSWSLKSANYNFPDTMWIWVKILSFFNLDKLYIPFYQSIKILNLLSWTPHPWIFTLIKLFLFYILQFYWFWLFRSCSYNCASAYCSLGIHPEGVDLKLSNDGGVVVGVASVVEVKKKKCPTLSNSDGMG